MRRTETEYTKTVSRLAKELRRSGDIPFGKIIDGSRLYTAPTCYDSVEDALNDCATSYRRSYWRTADRMLEVWCEKDAIRALIQDTTWEYAVPLMVTRGFASESIVQQLAEDVKRSGKPRVILALNDYDPSGALMLNDIIRRAQHYAPSVDFVVEQVAVTREQVAVYRLPTRPTKGVAGGNSHTRALTDQSHTRASDALTIARLAGLTRGEYDRLRHYEAVQLGWRVDTLDVEVQKARNTGQLVTTGILIGRPSLPTRRSRCGSPICIGLDYDM